VTAGKLVRDLIPDLIRQSGRDPRVRYLSGGELIEALAAKLQEEAAEAAGAIDDRDHLLEELADTYEVISALMAHHGIQWRHVVEEAEMKAERRGRFETGAWLAMGIESPG
jgi:predicted house-cleaning noncanonical NTP pyrophosphatase (MazG superfamily)